MVTCDPGIPADPGRPIVGCEDAAGVVMSCPGDVYVGGMVRPGRQSTKLLEPFSLQYETSGTSCAKEKECVEECVEGITARAKVDEDD